MGSPITEQRQLYAALNNCAFVSTENLKDGVARPFCFLMDASMLGVGVGFDTKVQCCHAYVHICMDVCVYVCVLLFVCLLFIHVCIWAT